MVSQTIALSLSLLTAVVTPVSLRDHLAWWDDEWCPAGSSPSPRSRYLWAPAQHFWHDERSGLRSGVCEGQSRPESACTLITRGLMFSHMRWTLGLLHQHKVWGFNPSTFLTYFQADSYKDSLTCLKLNRFTLKWSSFPFIFLSHIFTYLYLLSQIKIKLPVKST